MKGQDKTINLYELSVIMIWILFLSQWILSEITSLQQGYLVKYYHKYYFFISSPFYFRSGLLRWNWFQNIQDTP